MELARARELHAGVKVEHDTTSVAHEIQVGDARKRLESTGLLVAVAERTAAS